MKLLFALLLALPMAAAAQDSTATASAALYARADITQRLELARSPLVTKTRPPANDIAARHLRRAGRCFIAGIGLAILAGGINAVLATDDYGTDAQTAASVSLVAAVGGIGFTLAGGWHLIDAGKALSQP